MTETSGRWCRACGVAVDGGAHACPECSWALDPPDLGLPWIGSVLKVSGGLRTKWGLVVSIDGAQATAEVKPGEVVQIETANLAGMERQGYFGSDLPTAAGRLMAAHLAAQQNQVKGKWNAEGAAALAWTLGTQTIGRKRGAVLDWLVLGLAGHVDGTGLTATEVAWYRARHAAVTDDVATLVEQLALLPDAGYPYRVDLVLRHVTALRAEPARAERIAETLDGQVQRDHRAKALCVLLRGGSMPERIASLESFAAEITLAAPGQGDQARALASAVQQGTFPDPGQLPLPITRGIARWTSGRQGADLDANADDLVTLPVSMVDDLIDSGAVTAGALRSQLLTGPHGPYFAARVAPGSLTIDQAYQLEFVAEYARRLYQLGDLERLTQFPPGEPDADHYIALLNLKNNPAGGHREGLRPRALELLERVDAYLDGAAENDGGLPAPEILADTTLWRLLRSAALKGQIVLSAEERAKEPAFAAWCDLIEMQRLCFSGEWAQVLTIGMRLKDELTEEALRDEALNMAAYAEAVLGRPGNAMLLIEDALEGGYTEALVINASIVASELGSERAAIFLAKIFDEAPDRSVAAQALLKGVGLWFTDDESQTIPPSLVTSLRRALQETQTNEALRLFLRVMSDHDTAWLATAAVTTTSSEQEQMVSVWRTWAGAGSPGPVTITDVAKVVVSLNKQPVVHQWAAKELERLIDLLMSAVQQDFGEASWVVGSVRTLTDARLLNLVQESVLMCEAGAHLAVRLQEDGGEISPKDEVELIFAPAERWHAEKGDLPSGLIEAVDDAVGGCLGAGALAMAVVTERRRAEFGHEWDALVARERWDTQNYHAILRAEAQALSFLEGYVDRCRKYLQRLDRFPIPERTEKLRIELAGSVDEWGREIARLRSFL